MATDLLDPVSRLRQGSRLRGTQYVVVRRIGGGGMGALFEIEHRRLRKRLIAKMLQPGLRSRRDLLIRMDNEARTLARIGHRHIVEVYDLGVTTDGIPFFVMEKLEGKNLRRVLKERVRLDLADSLVIASEILEGLGHAHREGVIHRDIKPENLFLARAGAAMITKILDFGIAKVVDGDGEITGAKFIGTPHYASPEQLTGDPASEKSDIYSVGVVLFELLAGRRPFAGPTPRDFMRQHAHDEPPRLSKLADVPTDLDKLVARMLEKDPRKRPVNASWLAGELDRIRRRAEYVCNVDADTTQEMLRAVLESKRSTPVATPEGSPEEISVDTPCVTTGSQDVKSDEHRGNTLAIPGGPIASSIEAPLRSSELDASLASAALPRSRWVRWFAALMLLVGLGLSAAILFFVREASGRDHMPPPVLGTGARRVSISLAHGVPVPPPAPSTVAATELPPPMPDDTKTRAPTRAANGGSDSIRRTSTRPAPAMPHPVSSVDRSDPPPPSDDDEWIRAL